MKAGETVAGTTDSAAYRERLRQLLPELRQIEGFPIGSDEDILALSDPPYYTACPNPFLGEFIAEHGTPYDEATDDYHREPFAADVSEGKNDPIYNAHSYHTKVPHKAIMRYILHYTDPGDIVFDGFCGTGMTGVAAQLCGAPDPEFKLRVENEWRSAGHPKPDWGARTAILCDLSPAATFITYNYNTPVDVHAFEREANRILGEVEAELGWMYETTHTDGLTKGRINYTVWSEIFVCPSCGGEIVFWDAAVDPASGFRLDAGQPISCVHCGTAFATRGAERAFETHDVGGTSLRQVKTIPVQVAYQTAHGRFVKPPNARDVELAGVPGTFASVPSDRVIEGDEARRNDWRGYLTVRDFYFPRSAEAYGIAWRLAQASPASRTLQFWLQSTALSFTRLNRYLAASFSQVNRYLKGTLYVAPFQAEPAPRYALAGKIKRLASTLLTTGVPVAITTQSATGTGAPDSSVDYVFVDPPFGANIMYADLNFFWEAWLRVITQAGDDAVVSKTRGKALADYQAVMTACFEENRRILKPGRWMTVEFHNSSNAVWNAIQEAIQRAGFVVADVRVLDKKVLTMQQMTSAGAVKQDLVISAYKPKAGFEARFQREAGTEEGAWEFVRQHLEQLPVFIERDGRVEVVAERQNYLLYDRMIAFHIQRGATIPLSAAPFYAGLKQRFPERDGMYFTEVQAADYDRQRVTAEAVEQLSIFVVDEKSAIQWLRSEIASNPQTFQDLQPKFLRELQQNRYENLPELRDLLAQGFLEDPTTHRWRVPDANKQADLEGLRVKALLNEFATYLPGSGKLKRFRLEAIRTGFADLWARRDYRAIIRLAERLPAEVVQEDPALLMYYDNAVTREGTG